MNLCISEGVSILPRPCDVSNLFPFLEVISLSRRGPGITSPMQQILQYQVSSISPLSNFAGYNEGLLMTFASVAIIW